MSPRRLAGALAVSILVGTAAAAPAAWSADPAGDSVTVGALGAFTPIYSPINAPNLLEEWGYANVEARSGADGARATGRFEFHFGGGFGPTWSGDVTCLSVSGDRAAVGVEGALSFQGEGHPFAGVILALDGGPPAPGPPNVYPLPWPDVFDPPDRLDFRELPVAPGPSTCPSPTAAPPGTEVATYTPVLSNDVTVVDAPSKEQCKRGGWAAYGFRNQGQCVAAASRDRKG